MSGEQTIQVGDHGDLVSTMQSKLVDNGYDPGPVDGWFGDRTAAAVTAFQTDKGLQVDAVCGNQTWAALYGDLSVSPGRTDHGGSAPAGPSTLKVTLDGARVGGDQVHLTATVHNTGKVAVTESSLIQCQLRVRNPSVSGEGFEVSLQNTAVRPLDPGGTELIHFDVQTPVLENHFYQADATVFDDSTRYDEGEFDFQ